MQDNHPIIVRYPDKKHIILRLTELHSAFLDICDEYSLIVGEIDTSPKCARDSHQAAMLELQRLRHELEEEIGRWLHTNETMQN